MSSDRSVLCISFEGGFKSLIVVFIYSFNRVSQFTPQEKKQKMAISKLHQAPSFIQGLITLFSYYPVSFFLINKV